jgi:hypothetical protein
MNPKPFASELAEAIVAYCDAIDVPDFDEASIALANRRRVRHIEPTRTRRRLTACVAVLVALVIVLCNVPAVVAGVQRVFAAFTVDAGRTRPMTMRVVDLERARADMPFAVIAPPSIAGAPIVAVDEMYADAFPAGASVVFEIHGTAPGPEVMIIETNAAGYHAPTVFAIRGPADAATVIPRFRSLESPAPWVHPAPSGLLRGSLGGRTFAPASWVAHGTRVVVMSPPGFLSGAQLQTIRREMSR